MAENRYKDICDKTINAVKSVGEYIRAQRKDFTHDKVEFKGAHNLVSYVDKQAEIMLIEELRTICPEAGFITEEGGAEYNGEQVRWIIDPLDGTTNFVHGMPPYCVSVALMDGDNVVVGVVYEVTLDEMFYAWEDSPAYLNGAKISASTIDNLSNALVAIGFSHSAIDIDGYLVKVAEYQKNTDGIRRVGSAAADLVYVACGRLDAFAQERLSPWDVAGGAFIAQRAGAVVTDNSGGNDYIFGGQIVATAPAIFKDFIATVD